MDLGNPRPIFLIAGAVFAGIVGWKIVQNLQQNKKMMLRSKSIDTPNKKNTCVSVSSDKKEFFLQLMRLGEQSLAAGRYEEAADHLADAIMYCDNKESLNEIFLTSLPKPIYDMYQTALKAKTQMQLVKKIRA